MVLVGVVLNCVVLVWYEMLICYVLDFLGIVVLGVLLCEVVIELFEWYLGFV